MKKFRKVFFRILLSIAVVWGILTVFVEMKSGEESALYGKKMAKQNAVVVYDPDPFYNLEQQVSNAFAEGLAQHNWLVKVVTVKSAEKLEEEFDLYVFCANTYNWAPDHAVTSFIKNLEYMDHKSAVALTVGSGSTARAARLLEQTIKEKGARLEGSREYWLMRPNDENRTDESNVAVAVDLARKFGATIGLQLQSEATNFNLSGPEQ